MKKEGVIIIILILAVIGISIFAYITYTKNNELNLKYSQLSTDKNKAVSDMEQCRNELQKKNSEYSMLQEDVSKIYKSCITDNACKGHFPNIRWNCNNVGDETNENPSHVCFCDSSCKLIINEN